MTRAFVFAVIAALVTACTGTSVDADTRDLLRRDMTAVATAIADQDYVTAAAALERLLGDTEAAYLAGKISSSQRSDIATAAAKVQADLDAILAPPETTFVPAPANQGNQGNNGNGNGRGPNGNNGNGNSGPGNNNGNNGNGNSGNGNSGPGNNNGNGGGRGNN